MADWMGTPMLDTLPDLILAVGALGTASYGLVDVSKAFGGGVSNHGFARVAATMRKLYPARPGPLGLAEALDVLRAGWINGKPMAEQILQARHLLRLRLDPVEAPALAVATGLDAPRLAALAAKLDRGVPLDEADQALSDRFDQIVTLLLEGAYQQADQAYRNAAKAWAVAVSLGLALLGGWLLPRQGGYLWSPEFWQAVVIGLLATPLAPVSKDLASALGAGVKALQAVRK
jgi:hypothetical protein